ncbi:MAG: tetratricopeptide repeat protein, partial [Chloroflexi bacterium]|nr:tetratricopeptide repeat protein [Chloroflexota bacterium]
NYAEAVDYCNQSLSIRQLIGDKRGTAVSLHNLGDLAYAQENYAGAQDYYQQSLAISQAIGNQRLICYHVTYLGFVYIKLQHDQTLSTFHRALTIASQSGLTPLLLEAMIGFVWLYQQHNEPVSAAELVGLIQNHPVFNSEIKKRLDEFLPSLQESLPSGTFAEALDRGKAHDLNEVVERLLNEFPRK